MTASPYRTDIQVRFADSDALGHINNASFAAYVEVARLDFLAALGKSVRSLILANLYIDYRRQVGWDESVHVETHVEKLGNSSMTLIQTVYANGARAADVRSVVVHFDYAANKSQSLTDEMRARLEPYII
ncbi:MAG TPA: thioesterase family protein [Gemmatimonadaceae bacterium]|jgi:acyl-CoA thioester hydrolase